MGEKVLFILLSLSLFSCRKALYIDDEIVLNEPNSTITINDMSFQVDKQAPKAEYVHNKTLSMILEKMPSLR